MKSHTNIEQSKKLVELGLDPKTADMAYFDRGSRAEVIHWEETDFDISYDIPCWSACRLMELMCEGKDYDISTSFGGWRSDKFIKEWFCIYEAEYGEAEWEYHPVHDKTLIGACYKMMVWLLKNKKL